MWPWIRACFVVPVANFPVRGLIDEHGGRFEAGRSLMRPLSVASLHESVPPASRAQEDLSLRSHPACSRPIRNVSKIQSQLKNDKGSTKRFRNSGETQSQPAGIESGLHARAHFLISQFASIQAWGTQCEYSTSRSTVSRFCVFTRVDRSSTMHDAR